jgi:hypothetical protein
VSISHWIIHWSAKLMLIFKTSARLQANIIYHEAVSTVKSLALNVTNSQQIEARRRPLPALETFGRLGVCRLEGSVSPTLPSHRLSVGAQMNSGYPRLRTRSGFRPKLSLPQMNSGYPRSQDSLRLRLKLSLRRMNSRVSGNRDDRGSTLEACGPRRGHLCRALRASLRLGLLVRQLNNADARGVGYALSDAGGRPRSLGADVGGCDRARRKSRVLGLPQQVIWRPEQPERGSQRGRLWRAAIEGRRSIAGYTEGRPRGPEATTKGRPRRAAPTALRDLRQAPLVGLRTNVRGRDCAFVGSWN